MLDNKQVVFPLFSEQILSILDEASEKTFLCSQGDVSKAGLEEKNMVATLGFIVEQTLVRKPWTKSHLIHVEKKLLLNLQTFNKCDNHIISFIFSVEKCVIYYYQRVKVQLKAD